MIEESCESSRKKILRFTQKSKVEHSQWHRSQIYKCYNFLLVVIQKEVKPTEESLK